MISISHVQARRLIQAQVDERKLPEEQWTALHAHLEACPECRAFQVHLAAAERNLRRILHQYRDPVHGPRETTPALLAALYRERKMARCMGRWMLGGASTFLLSVLLFIGWSAGVLPGDFTRVLAGPAATATSIPPTPIPSPTPTRAPAAYRGVIAYEYRPGKDGADDIYLLNAGSEPVNLTNDPADDHAPAWSPDGEWLAFLSNRTGKDEVYGMHVSGTRLTQLTNLPDVAWRGPISWRSDGQMLALIGERKFGETSKTWVYLIPLDGSIAYPMGKSGGAVQVAFSPKPDQKLLAFSSLDNWDGQLSVYDFAGQHGYFFTDGMSLSGLWAPNRAVDLLDWSIDGTSILYRVASTRLGTFSSGSIDRAELRAAAVTLVTPDNLLASKELAGDLTGGNLPALSWTGVKDEFAYLVDADGLGPGCKTIRIGIAVGYTVKESPYEVPGLCIEEGLERANWRLREKSVLVIGRQVEDAAGERGTAGSGAAIMTGERGLYIVRFLANGTRVDWLADASKIDGPPLLRPSMPSLAIDPKPIQVAQVLPPSPLPGPEVGDLLVVSKLGDRTLIDRLSPGSDKRTTINQSVGENSCLAWSPDHTRIAFLSDRARPRLMPEVFVMDGSGLHPRQLTQRSFINGLNPPSYECPLWSADGRWLAAMVHASDVSVAVIPVDKKDGAPRYLPPSEGINADRLGWLPDGRLLVAYSDSYPAMQIILRAYKPTSIKDGKESEYVELLNAPNWSYVTNIAASADGKSLALAVMHYGENSFPTFGLLTAALSPATGQPGMRPGALNFQPRYQRQGNLGLLNTDSLRWLPGGMLGYTLHYPADQKVKAEVFTIAADGSGAPERVASFTDELWAATWSPDGRWLTAITATGRFVLDTSLASTVTPTRVDEEQGYALNW